MIFFDVPISPDWVEQRIGRLDRIGQTETIKIHVPYVEGTISSFYTRWYHEGLNAFQSILAGGVLYRNEFGNELSQCAKKKDEKKLSALIGKTVKFRENLLKKLESGRDRLLELNSYDETVAKGLVKQIKEMDANGRMETFMLKMFEHFGVSVDELDKSFYKLTPTERYMEAFPGLPNDGVLATFDRTRALSRDDLAFLTWDHAMFSGACEMMLGSENGNSAFAVYPKSGQKGFLLEVIYILECTAPKELHLDRFLPTTPLRVVVNHNFEDVSEEYNHDEMRHALEDGQLQLLHEHKTLLQGIIPNMLKKARNLARKDKYQLVDDAIDTAHSDLGDELERLVNLQKVNDHITDKEIELLKERISNVDEHIRDSHLRLDAVRLILLQ
jgi:ATP-dependent helicase HepA